MLKNSLNKLNIGVIGYGYWGPNIVRNFYSFQNVNVEFICDVNHSSLKKAQHDFPFIKTTNNPNVIFSSKKINAVAIVTPLSSHYQLAKKALISGKHIFVEKPFVSNSSQAKELLEISEKRKLIIMVDHTFLFTGSVRKIKELINKNIIGKLYYYDSTRVNLGLFQNDTNVLWDLAPHDFSIMDYLIKEKPTGVVATGKDHFERKLEDIAFVTVFFENNIIAHFNFNWLSPVKIRSVLIGGSKKMVVWNDLESNEKIKIYDKGIKIRNKKNVYNTLVDYRIGDILMPKIDMTEALKVELEYFTDCVLNLKKPINDGYQGLRIIKLLEATHSSLKKQGQFTKIND